MSCEKAGFLGEVCTKLRPKLAKLDPRSEKVRVSVRPRRRHPPGAGGHTQSRPPQRADQTEAGRSKPQAYEDRGKNGFDSPMKTLRGMTFAPFHTIENMMTVILRIDAGASSDPLLLARFIDTLLSDLVSIAIFSAMLTSSFSTVWHTGCPTCGCEGLRVLETRQATGWGLGIPEIGRTGIFSPRNNYRRSSQANPQHPK